MKYTKLGVGAVCILSMLNTAHAEGQHDRSLIALEAIDHNYEYISMERANFFFNIISNALNAVLPMTVDEDLTATGFEADPYKTIFSYKLNADKYYSESDRRELKARLSSKETIRIFCDGMFGNEYQKANNTKVFLNYSDAYDKEVALVELNKHKCR
ncbi:hypothetical protein [Psychrobacter sanguinis]|uniref:hypothetical protein n=1 Tax=Psychrobacter sanguinis TaxID=861445 RepID=UPI00289C05D0|nr:hypothetical protein [Psychrobacter sanguinis]